MSEIQVWDLLPLLIKIRWYADVLGYAMAVICYAMAVMCIVALIILGAYIKIKEWWRTKKS